MGGTHKIFADIDVDGEVKGTSLDLNGNAQIDGTITVGVDDTGYDVKFFGATSGKNMLWDESGDRLIFANNTYLALGTSSNILVYHTGSHGHFQNYTGNLTITNLTDDGDVIFQSDDGSGGTTTYFYLDGSATQTKFDKDTRHSDNVKVLVGSAGDAAWYHDGTMSRLDNYTGNLQIVNYTDDGDIIFKSDDGSGGTTAYLTLDGGLGYTRVQKNLRFDDSISLALGVNNDFLAYHNGTNTYFLNDTGNLEIQQRVDDGDIIFKCDDGSGGVTDYIRIDGSHSRVVFSDNIQATFGSSSRLSIKHDGTDATITETQGDLKIINTANDKDIIFQSDDGSGGTTTYMTLDGSVTRTIFSQEARFTDSINLKFGTGGDMMLYHDGSNSYLDHTGTGDLLIRQGQDDKDIKFVCDDGSGGLATYLTLDGSAGYTTAQKDIRIEDGVSLRVGNGGDARFMHNGTDTYLENFTGDLIIRNGLDDKDVILQSDDGSGGVTAYLTLDGSTTQTIFAKETVHNDSVKGTFGTGGDLQLYHNGSNSQIDNTTGHLQIRNFADNSDIIFETDDGSGNTTAYLTIDGGAERNIFSKAVSLTDSVKLMLGSSNDLQIFHDGTNTLVENYVGDFTFEQRTDDGDMIFKCDNGSGGLTAYLTLDGGSAKVLVSRPAIFYDTIEMASYIYHNGDTNSYFGFSAADTFNLHVGGAEVLRVNGGSTTDEAAVSILCGGGTNVENIALLLKGDTNGEALKLKIQNPNDSGTLTGAGILSYEPDADTFNIGQSTTHANMAISIDNSENVTFAGNVTLGGNNPTLTLNDSDGRAAAIDVVGNTFRIDDVANNAAIFTADLSTNPVQTTIAGALTVTGNLTANGNIVGDDSTNITNIASIGADTYSADADSTTRIGMSATSMDFLVEDEDVFNCSSTTLTVDAKLVAKKRVLAKTSNTDANADGDIVYFGGTTSMDAGKIYYFNSSGAWALADADAESTAKGMLGVALGAASDTNGMLIRGMVTLDTDPGTVGDTLFLSTTAGVATSTAPSGNGDIVRVIGYCLDSTNGQIYFNPDGTFVEVTA